MVRYICLLFIIYVNDTDLIVKDHLGFILNFNILQYELYLSALILAN